MRQKKKLLMAALLAAAVSTPVFAQPEALSEGELDEVSAQGLQIVENHNATFGDHGPMNSQNNNLDSVQINDDSLVEARAGYGAVLANSAVNSTANYLYDSLEPPEEPPSEGKNFSNYFSQTNTNVAINHRNIAKNDDRLDGYYADAGNLDKETQRINTGVEEKYDLEIIRQDNNNNSVQLNENAQFGASGIAHTNTAASAVNTAENIFYANSVSNTTGIQTNNQTASNFENNARIYSKTTYEDVDVKAYAYNKEDWGTQIVNNAGLTLAHDETEVNKNVTIVKQNNNNNSVQLNDESQRNTSFVTLKNVAKSAANNAVNSIYITNGLLKSLFPKQQHSLQETITMKHTL